VPEFPGGTSPETSNGELEEGGAVGGDRVPVEDGPDADGVPDEETVPGAGEPEGDVPVEEDDPVEDVPVEVVVLPGVPVVGPATRPRPNDHQ
jgi:hypothetical protein